MSERIEIDPCFCQRRETNKPDITVLTGGNVKTLVTAFANGTEEYVNFRFTAPADLDTSGTVTFRVWCQAATAAVGKNVAHTLGFAARDDAEDYDGAYTDEDSGDKAIDSTQDNLDEHTWTETVSNLGWAANDLIFGRYSRPSASANDLVGDLHVHLIVIDIPIT